MKIRRLAFFALAIAIGATAFGLFWSAQVRARTVGGGGGPYCSMTNPPGNATMCYMGKTTITNVPPATQSQYLTNKQATCGACPTTGM